MQGATGAGLGLAIQSTMSGAQDFRLNPKPESGLVCRICDSRISGVLTEGGLGGVLTVVYLALTVVYIRRVEGARRDRGLGSASRYRAPCQGRNPKRFKNWPRDAEHQVSLTTKFVMYQGEDIQRTTTPDCWNR